jgi:hypothetical protein
MVGGKTEFEMTVHDIDLAMMADREVSAISLHYESDSSSPASPLQ